MLKVIKLQIIIHLNCFFPILSTYYDTVYTVSAEIYDKEWDFCKMMFSVWLCSILAPVPSWEKVLSLAQKTNRRAILSLRARAALNFPFSQLLFIPESVMLHSHGWLWRFEWGVKGSWRKWTFQVMDEEVFHLHNIEKRETILKEMMVFLLTLCWHLSSLERMGIFLVSIKIRSRAGKGIDLPVKQKLSFYFSK